jgi:hypothetical protein
VVHAYNPSTLEAEAEDLEFKVCLSYTGDPISKNKQTNKKQNQKTTDIQRAMDPDTEASKFVVIYGSSHRKLASLLICLLVDIL